MGGLWFDQLINVQDFQVTKSPVVRLVWWEFPDRGVRRRFWGRRERIDSVWRLTWRRKEIIANDPPWIGGRVGGDLALIYNLHCEGQWQKV